MSEQQNKKLLPFRKARLPSITSPLGVPFAGPSALDCKNNKVATEGSIPISDPSSLGPKWLPGAHPYVRVLNKETKKLRNN